MADGFARQSTRVTLATDDSSRLSVLNEGKEEEGRNTPYPGQRAFDLALEGGRSSSSPPMRRSDAGIETAGMRTPPMRRSEPGIGTIVCVSDAGQFPIPMRRSEGGNSEAPRPSDGGGSTTSVRRTEGGGSTTTAATSRHTTGGDTDKDSLGGSKKYRAAKAAEYAPEGDLEKPKQSPAVIAALSGRTMLRQVGSVWFACGLL